MVGRLIVGLIWLTFVHSESPQSASIPEGLKESSMGDDGSPKTKRYLTHEHGGQVASPCPPFYPNFGMHTRMHDTRPYGPPAYPKAETSHSIMSLGHRELQYVHAPSYSSYVPHQTIQLIKPEHKAPIYQAPIYQAPIHQAPIYKAPIYQAPMHQSPIYKAHIYEAPKHQAPIYKAPIYEAPMHQAPVYQAPMYKAPMYQVPIWKPAIQHHPTVVKQPSYYHHYQPPMYQESKYYSKQPVFSYAPAYQKPMSSLWPATDIKKYDLPSTQISYHQPAIVFKPEPPKCAPCPPSSHSPETSYVKVVQAPHVEQSKVYLPPAPVLHQPNVKPCVH